MKIRRGLVNHLFVKDENHKCEKIVVEQGAYFGNGSNFMCGREVGLGKNFKSLNRIVSKVLAGQSMRGVAVEEGISYGMLYGWVKKCEAEGYNGLIPKKKGKQSLNTRMNKNTISKPLSETEREELIRLRAEVEFITAENEVIKKDIALERIKALQRQEMQVLWKQVANLWLT